MWHCGTVARCAPRRVATPRLCSSRRRVRRQSPPPLLLLFPPSHHALTVPLTRCHSRHRCLSIADAKVLPPPECHARCHSMPSPPLQCLGGQPEVAGIHRPANAISATAATLSSHPAPCLQDAAVTSTETSPIAAVPSQSAECRCRRHRSSGRGAIDDVVAVPPLWCRHHRKRRHQFASPLWPIGLTPPPPPPHPHLPPPHHHHHRNTPTKYPAVRDKTQQFPAKSLSINIFF